MQAEPVIPDPAEAAAPLIWRTLERGSTERELSLTRASQLVTGIGLVLACCVLAFVDRELGMTMAVVAAWCFAWFTLARAAMHAGFGLPLFRWLNPMVEMLLPALVLVALARTEGPEYALGSWVPPQLWAIFLAATVLRFRPEVPAAMGALAAVAYGVVWVGVLQPALSSTEPSLLHGNGMQLVRMLTLASMGLAGSLAVLWLHAAVDRAGRVARSHDLFGKYRLVRELASGGMGTVLEAIYCPEGGFRRRVAIKRIHPHLAQDATFLARFRTEAALASRLNHPNVVMAIDFGRVEDTWFFAMEYVDGPTLHEILRLRRETAMPLEQRVVAAIARDIAEALHYAHAVARDDRGRLLRVVHRDLSPTNILLDRSGRVRITDFGVARALRGQHDVVSPTMTGKPAYMAPEQLRQQAYDERADLFALGVVMFEMACNARLFGRDEPHAAMLAVLESVIPRPSTVRADLHPGWDVLIERLLARDPAFRLGSAADLCAAISALQQDLGVATAEEIAAVVSAVEDVPDLDVDSTDEVLALTQDAEG